MTARSDEDEIVIPFTVGDSNRIARIETRLGMLMWMAGGLLAFLVAGFGWVVMHL